MIEIGVNDSVGTILMFITFEQLNVHAESGEDGIICPTTTYSDGDGRITIAKFPKDGGNYDKD